MERAVELKRENEVRTENEVRSLILVLIEVNSEFLIQPSRGYST